MRAMVLRDYGNDATFQAATMTKPNAEAGHVVVRIEATSVNTVDTMIRGMGKELPLSPDLPAVLGMDFAGTVESVGKRVTQFSPGDEVYGCAGGLANLQGALAEFMPADARLIAHKPKTLSMRQAAALPLVGITAYEGLTRAQVEKGKRVLVHGGTGGVGHVAVQLAKAFTDEVYATVSNDKQAAIVEGYEAIAINYRTETVESYVTQHTAGTGFNVIFDSVGGANMKNSFEAAALNGNIATTVSLLELDLTLAHFKGLSLHVVFMLIPMLHGIARAEHGMILDRLAALVDSGALTPLLDEQQFAFDEADQAYARLSSGEAIGKVVIEL